MLDLHPIIQREPRLTSVNHRGSKSTPLVKKSHQVCYNGFVERISWCLLRK
jgi:hypothetical protein